MMCVPRPLPVGTLADSGQRHGEGALVCAKQMHTTPSSGSFGPIVPFGIHEHLIREQP
jgi:hypothetical protein